MSNEGKMVEAGDVAPAFCLLDQDGREVCLEDFSGKWIVLYFYLCGVERVQREDPLL